MSLGAILVIGAETAEAALAQSGHDLAVTRDVPGAVARVSERNGTGTLVSLAVIGPDVPQPLSAARELRRLDGEIGLAFLVEPDKVEEMKTKLGLVPDLRGAAVFAADIAPTDLESSLRKTASTADRSRGVRDIFAEMNRLLEHPPVDHVPSESRSVSESYLAAVIEHAPEAIISVDTTGRLVAANEAANAMLGIRASESEGLDLAASLTARPEDALRRIVSQAAEGETRERQELELETADGRELLASVTAAPVLDHGERVAGVVIIARDITSERRAEERLRELQRAKSLATLAGGVAHDFNNLLVTIQGWAEIARETPDDLDTVTEALDNISASSERAADLARAMLAYSGRGRFELCSTNVTEVVGQMSGLIRATVARTIDVQFDLDDDLPDVLADQTQLRQVVMNLVTNASEALGEESGVVHIRTFELDTEETGGVQGGLEHLPPGRYVTIEVNDTGPGMSDETRIRIFEPFFTTKFPGRGLGLAASHGIARAHGGDLTVDTQPGQGASFRLLLPLPRGDEH